MVKKLLVVLAMLGGLHCGAQYIYYKNPDSSVVRQCADTLERVQLLTPDSSGLTESQFNYVLKFYPAMLLKNIRVEFKNTIAIAHTRPLFSSIFKAPRDRVYIVTFSKATRSTLDSVIIGNLAFNAQLGLIASQVSQVEDMSTGGFFDFIGWYLKRLSRRGRNKMDAAAELKTLEVGLGYQLLALNRENEEKLQIDKWQNTRGYASYVKYTKNRAMKPALVSNFISDLPIYVTKQYR